MIGSVKPKEASPLLGQFFWYNPVNIKGSLSNDGPHQSITIPFSLFLCRFNIYPYFLIWIVSLVLKYIQLFVSSHRRRHLWYERNPGLVWARSRVGRICPGTPADSTRGENAECRAYRRRRPRPGSAASSSAPSGSRSPLGTLPRTPGRRCWSRCPTIYASLLIALLAWNEKNTLLQ